MLDLGQLGEPVGQHQMAMGLQTTTLPLNTFKKKNKQIHAD